MVLVLDSSEFMHIFECLLSTKRCSLLKSQGLLSSSKMSFLQNHCETGMLLHNFDSLHKSHPPQYFICILMLSNINYSRLEHVEVNKRPFRRCCHPRQQVLGVSSFAACGPTAIYMKMSSKFGAEVGRNFACTRILGMETGCKY